MVEEYALRNRFVSGRQMLSMVLRRFLCNDNSDIGYGIDAPTHLKYSDEGMEMFLNRWKHLAACIPVRYTVPHEGYRDILFRKIKGSKALSIPLWEYERKPASSRLYTDLITMLEKEVSRRRETLNQAQRDRALGAQSNL